jgi:threonine aldolase
VTLCLSKGLGCPLGALLAGRSELMARTRRFKHLFGGAMRQAGIVASAGVYALEHHVTRLVEDNANAQRLAEGLLDAGVPVDLEQVESNFVFIYPERVGLSRDEAAASLRAEGVLVSNAAPRGVLRAVTHLDISASDVERAIERARAAFSLQRSPTR